MTGLTQQRRRKWHHVTYGRRKQFGASLGASTSYKLLVRYVSVDTTSTLLVLYLGGLYGKSHKCSRGRQQSAVDRLSCKLVPVPSFAGNGEAASRLGDASARLPRQPLLSDDKN